MAKNEYSLPSCYDPWSRATLENWRCMDTETLFGRFEEVMDSLDEVVKKYYFIARETVPDLVATETDPRKFLLADHGDFVAAAQRMVNYWSNRYSFFGDRWLLPMTQTGMGCLTRQDVDHLRSGYLVMLTLPGERQIFVCDASRLQKHADPEVRVRLSFYIFTTALNATSRTHGVDVIVLVNASALRGSSGRYMDNMRVCHKSLPFIVKSFTTVPLLCEDGKTHVVEYLSFLFAKTHVHAATTAFAVDSGPSSTELAVKNLQEKGIPRIYLPEKVGGTPLFESGFADWIRMRLSLEDAMRPVLPERNLLPTLFPTKSNHAQKGLSQIIRRPKITKDDTVHKEEYVRKRNAMYARRSAHKTKIQKVALQDRKDVLESENKRLKIENQKLELLLARARVQVSFVNVIGNTSTHATCFTDTPTGQGTFTLNET